MPRSPSALRSALAPLPVPWGVAPGLRAALAAVLVLGGSLLVADLSIGGIAYLGVACAASFIGSGDYRARAVHVVAETLGAAVGMTVGALVPDTVSWVLVAAVVVGVAAGMVGCIGPASTGAAVMAVIGVSYTQFGRLPMPWWEPVAAYAVGSVVLLALSLVGALHHRSRYRLAAVAAVLDAAADLLDHPSDDARHRLALASAAARDAVAGYRGAVAGPLDAAWAEARSGAALAAQAVAASTAAPADPAGWRARAVAIRAGNLGDGPAGPPLPGRATRVRAALQAASNADVLWTGARIGLCVGAATALALALHPPAHAYWIALTVAVVLRPEYGAVLVRAVHRLAGTIVGVVLVAVLLELTRSPVWLAVAAAAALGLAGLARPRLYGLAVVGITGSALFSVAIGNPAAVEPWTRLLDTVLGCAVALVAGVLLWPRRGVPDQPRRFSAATAALSRMLGSSGAAAVDDAYRLAHGWRAELERDLAEPDPAHAAAAWLPVALQLEHVVDLAAATGDPAAADLLHGATTPSDALALLTAVAAQLRP
ncbi:FUSC family protein [Pseudonocardia benzenivorans]|uniref:FUSC family protein n=1 Tax=Pseudonocardia benzenivorans TaxID=228005 RepID=A0ABW3VLA5_9PSEU